MILVLGGTYDSRKLVEGILEQGKQVIYSSVTDYNVGSLPEDAGLRVRVGAMDEAGMAALIEDQGVTCLVDATHPYAKEVSLNAIAACEAAGIVYLRMERKRMADDGETTLGFSDYDAMVDYLLTQEGQVLLTTGSRQLEAYDRLPKDRLVVRVLPTAKVLSKCEALGYNPKRIIAMQGPFSYEMNTAMMAQYKIRFLTTKDSGVVGGVDEKIQAARDMGVKVLYIKRPDIRYPRVAGDVSETLGLLASEDLR
ncbi:MAG: precorrin-6A reductase [Eubacterium sp.]|nr:precorrin-6A reductase [Eubacterium sp.]